MNKHVEIHIEGLSFDCPFCEKSYKTRMSLDQHRKLKHPGARVEVEETQVQTTHDNNEDSASTSSSDKVAGSAYCCPVDLCTFSTDKEGIKGGVAAEHLQLDHGVSKESIVKAEKGEYKFRKVKIEKETRNVTYV